MKKTVIFASIAFFSLIQQAAAFSLKHKFDVFLGPFNASQTDFEYSLSRSNYQIKSNVRTFGLFDTLYPFEAQYATTGKISKDKFDTLSYKYQSRSRFTKRSKELVYDKNGNPIYRLSSKNGKEKKTNIDQSINTGDTTDLQTVFAKLAKQYNTVKFCRARFEVFDGKRRFDVIFADEGEDELKAGEHIPHNLKTMKCSMYIDKLNNDGDDLLWQLTSDKPIYFWIAEEPSAKHPYIARILIKDTPFGELNAYTTEISLREEN